MPAKNDAELEESARRAIRECADHAKTALYKTIGAIAHEMGEHEWVLYKWIETGRIPATSVPAFERACGCNAVTRSLATAANLLVIQAPLSKTSSCAEALHLTGRAIALTTRSEKLTGKNKDEAMRALNAAIESLASVRHLLLTKE